LVPKLKKTNCDFNQLLFFNNDGNINKRAKQKKFSLKKNISLFFMKEIFQGKELKESLSPNRFLSIKVGKLEHQKQFFWCNNLTCPFVAQTCLLALPPR